ncbi:hypothetical protein GCM10012275_24560 [Longimycelium tulufanense]|uniref:EspG family protein n=1 Tax=Longimycelium tulufanense TaxID=907463 RepID=A0A8J3FVN0_9PSEU|nr:ESX secretion-associated protein EspG [Longimycelium tulufanense]GGM52661.1 hypothetical protein GCM10012275_24560 [Longimycelium tulufanense]
MTLPRIPTLVYEVLWERLDLGVMPFPLVVFQHGRDDRERSIFKQRAYEWLQGQGLGDEMRLDTELDTALRTMANFDVELTLFYSDQEGQTRIGCFAAGGRALRVVLRGDEIDLAWTRTTHMAASALELLPAYGPGWTQSLRVPGTALEHAGKAWHESGMRTEAVRMLAESGADPRQADRFLQLYSTAHAIGQASALRPGPRRDRWLTADSPLTFIDTDTGRYAITQQGGWLTLAPADSRGMLSRLAGLLASGFS